MLTSRGLLAYSCATIVGIGFALPGFSAPPAGSAAGPASPARFTPLPDRVASSQYTLGPGPSGISQPRRFTGYPCTWSGSRDLAHGETAYRNGRYADAITRWKTAASKDCAIAAYKLGMLYYGGKSQVAADRSLGAAWLQVAAESGTASSPYYGQMSHLAVRTLTKSQRAEYTADYARVRTDLGWATRQ